MDVWSVFAGLLLFFPPTAVVFIASIIKLLALLNEKTLTWGKAFGYAALISISALVAYIVYLQLVP